jgi:hypothetical protein
MGPHALAICWLAGLPYQDMVAEVTQQPLTARTETKARWRPLTSFVATVAGWARTLAAPAAARVEVQPIAAAPVRSEF